MIATQERSRLAPFFLVVGAIRAARVNVGDAVWQKPHVLLDSLFDACHSALLRRRYLHAVRLMRL